MLVRTIRSYRRGAAASGPRASDITVYQTLAVNHDTSHDLPLDRAELLTPTDARP
jgi:hypothetical protein